MKISSIILTTTLLLLGYGVNEVQAVPTENEWGKGIYFDSYCSQKYPNSKPVLVINNVTGWKCRVENNSHSTDYGVDVADACLKSYGFRNPHGYGKYSNPYSWFCGEPKQAAEYVKK